MLYFNSTNGYVFNDEYINWKAFSVEMHKEYSKLENLL